MYTFGQFKTAIREVLWPDGSEASNLVTAHNKFFIDALIDLQTWVECLQQDNTSIVPHCATYYKCGLTVLDAPRGAILQVSVIDKIDPDTGEEDATAADDWCSEIVYTPIDMCHVRSYIDCYGQSCCLGIPYFFGLDPYACQKACYPTPTEAGVPAGLPLLPLGFHYPQTSTDSDNGRALAGRWAMERGKIYIAPWIQSTESIIIKWDGIKRIWTDSDPIDEDPLLSEAVTEYVRWQHADKYEHDESEMQRAVAAFTEARIKLIHQCNEETRLRECTASKARSTPLSIVSLYYNTEQSYTAECTAGTTGEPVTVTIPAGTIGSAISVADANQKAIDEAQLQAEARLDCEPEAVTYTNDPQTYTAACQGEAGAPPPEGDPVTVTIPAGTVSSNISKADANQIALAMAIAQAAAQLSCVYWNREKSAVAVCPTNEAITASATVVAHTHSSTKSQSEADDLAQADADNAALEALEALGTCTDVTVYWNEVRQASKSVSIWNSTGQTWCQSAETGAVYDCTGGGPRVPTWCQLLVTAVVPAHYFSNSSQEAANIAAQAMAEQLALSRLNTLSAQGICGSFTYYFGPIIPV